MDVNDKFSSIIFREAARQAVLLLPEVCSKTQPTTYHPNLIQFSESHPPMACASNPERICRKDVPLRLILVGKTGVGKSSLGNVLLEREDFRQGMQNSPFQGFVVCDGLESGTERCCSKFGHNNILNRSLEVIDTPGLFDTNSVDVMTTLKDFTHMLSLSAPGPHAVLFLVRCDVRFTKEEEEAFYKIKEMFNDDVLKHLVVVFTHGEQRNVPIETLIDRAPGSLKKILDLVDNNFAVMSKTEDMKIRRNELRDLFIKIDKVSAHGTEYYTDDLLRKLTESIEEEVKEKMKRERFTYDEAFRKTREEFNYTENWFFRLLFRLLRIVLLSKHFARLIGLTGILSVLDLDFVKSVGTLNMVDVTSIVNSLSANIKAYISQRRNTCTIS